MSDARTTLKASVLSSADILKTDVIDRKSDDIILNLNHNIYTFLLLLYSRQNEENKHLYSFIDKTKLNKIKLLALFSYITQMSGILYFALNWGPWYFTSSDVQYIHDCDIPTGNVNGGAISIAFNVNDSAIDNQQCTFSKYTYTQIQTMEAQNIAAKFIASFILLAFVTSDVLSIPRLITLSKIAKSKLKYAWIMLTLSQFILIATVVARIFMLIYNQDDVVDIFTVGISFIILTEIDDKLYGSVQNLNPLGDILFDVKFKKEDLSKYNVLYNYILVETHDCIVFICLFITTCIINFVFVCGPYIGIDIGEEYGAIIALIVVVPCVVLPLKPDCLRKLKR